MKAAPSEEVPKDWGIISAIPTPFQLRQRRGRKSFSKTRKKATGS
jgi:hypothetical protein